MLPQSGEVKTDRPTGLAGQLDLPIYPAPDQKRDPVSENKVKTGEGKT